MPSAGSNLWAPSGIPYLNVHAGSLSLNLAYLEGPQAAPGMAGVCVGARARSRSS